MSDDFESRLVWLLGSPRSGSTWLFRMLGAHATVVEIDEPLIGQYLGPFVSDLPEATAPDISLDNFTLMRERQGEPDTHFFASEYTEVWQPLLKQLLLGRFFAHATRNSAVPVSRATVLIKEPNGSQSADLIMGTLPQARLLFLLRDGRDVVDSEIAAYGEGSWISRKFPSRRGVAEADRMDFVIQSAYKWLWRTEVVQQAFAAHPGPKHRLRYEDLLRDPLIHLGAVHRWLGLPVDEDELAAVVERNSMRNLPDAVRGPQGIARAGKPGLWRENLSDEEGAAVEEILGPKLRELGY